MLASVVGLLGVFFVALPTAILASGFVEDVDKRRAASSNGSNGPNGSTGSNGYSGSSKDGGDAGAQPNPLARLDLQDSRFESLEHRFSSRKQTRSPSVACGSLVFFDRLLAVAEERAITQLQRTMDLLLARLPEKVPNC